MPEYLDNRSGRSTFAEKMKEKETLKTLRVRLKKSALVSAMGQSDLTKTKRICGLMITKTLFLLRYTLMPSKSISIRLCFVKTTETYAPSTMLTA